MASLDVFLLLLSAVVITAPIAARLRLPLPIALVITGMLIATTPAGMVPFAPDQVFILFVPPILYYGSLTQSVRDLRRNQRPIALLAIGCVLATIATVAPLAHALVPGLTWAPAVVLGAIVAPPDAAMTIALARRLGLPRRLLTILEGESLFNDVSAFTIFSMGITATMTGSFTPRHEMLQLMLATVGGLVVGYLAARAVVFIRRYLHDPRSANALSLLTPYATYIPAEALHCSGVLAVVMCGLHLNRIAARIVDARTRLQNQQVWDMVLYILNGLICLLIGTSLGHLAWDLIRSPDPSLLMAMTAVVICVILVRLVWVALATHVPRWLSPALARRDPVPRLALIGFLGWTGIRGGDTLIAALALPLLLPDGTPFPARHAIQAIALAVILSTLVIQGLTLGPLARLFRLGPDGEQRSEHDLARARLAEAGNQRLDAIAVEQGLDPNIVELLRQHHHLRRRVGSGHGGTPRAADVALAGPDLVAIDREIIATERLALIALRDELVIGQDVLRRMQRELDLEAMVREPDDDLDP